MSQLKITKNNLYSKYNTQQLSEYNLIKKIEERINSVAPTSEDKKINNVIKDDLIDDGLAEVKDIEIAKALALGKVLRYYYTPNNFFDNHGEEMNQVLENLSLEIGKPLVLTPGNYELFRNLKIIPNVLSGDRDNTAVPTLKNLAIVDLHGVLYHARPDAALREPIIKSNGLLGKVIYYDEYPEEAIFFSTDENTLIGESLEFHNNNHLPFYHTAALLVEYGKPYVITTERFLNDSDEEEEVIEMTCHFYVSEDNEIHFLKSSCHFHDTIRNEHYSIVDDIIYGPYVKILVAFDFAYAENPQGEVSTCQDFVNKQITKAQQTNEEVVI